MTNPQFAPSTIDAGECVSTAWEMLKRNYGMYLGISLVAILMTACIPCVNIFIMGPVMGGVYYVALRDMRGEPVDFGMMFKGFEKFVPLMIIGLIQAIPGIIAQMGQYAVQFADLGLRGPAGGGDFQFFQASGTDFVLSTGLIVAAVAISLVFMVVSFLLWAGLFFAVPLIMEHDLGAVDAIKLSIQAATSNFGGLIVVLIFSILIGLVGFLMLCLGLFLLSIPLIYLTNAVAYRAVFPYFERQFNMAPPPPNEYGFGNAI